MLGLDPLKIVGYVGKIGAKGFNLGKKIGKKSIDILADETDDIVNGTARKSFNKLKGNLKNAGKKTIRGTGKIASGLGEEAEFLFNSTAYLGKAVTGQAPFTSAKFGKNSPITKFASHFSLLKATDDNLIGYKMSGLGTTVALTGALVLGGKEGIQEFNQNRVGYNDGSLYSHSPRMMINGQSFQSMGNSYANNAGATGDLGFALHNQRRTGLF